MRVMVGGVSFTREGAFTYDPPVIRVISPHPADALNAHESILKVRTLEIPNQKLR